VADVHFQLLNPSSGTACLHLPDRFLPQTKDVLVLPTVSRNFARYCPHFDYAHVDFVIDTCGSSHVKNFRFDLIIVLKVPLDRGQSIDQSLLCRSWYSSARVSDGRHSVGGGDLWSRDRRGSRRVSTLARNANMMRTYCSLSPSQYRHLRSVSVCSPVCNINIDNNNNYTGRYL